MRKSPGLWARLLAIASIVQATNNNTLIDILRIADQTESGVFRSLLNSVGIDVLQIATSIAVFVPNDLALKAIPQKWTENKEYHLHLRSFLGYHFTDEVKNTTELLREGSTELTMMNGEGLNVKSTSSAIVLGPSLTDTPARLLYSEEASNGIAHFIDQGLQPSFVNRTLLDVAESQSQFSSFVAALKLTSLDRMLRDIEGSYTLLVPANLYLTSTQPSALKDILSYHIVRGIWPPDMLEAGVTLMTISGSQISVASKTRFAGGKATSANLLPETFLARNGIILTIDERLLPEIDESQSTIGSLDSSEPGLLLEALNGTAVAEAIDAAGLTLTLQGNGPFTLFAPSDAALSYLPSKYFSNQYKFHLQDILLYHLYAGELRADALQGDRQKTLSMGNGESMDGSNFGGSTYFKPSFRDGMGAMLERKDTLATNGVIHVIADVLAPFSLRSGVTEVAERASLSGFVRAIEVANLTSLLSDPFASFTILAPSDTAWRTFEGIDELLTNPQRMAEYLNFHILTNGVIPSTLLSNGSSLLPMSGGTIVAGVTEQGVVTFKGENMTGKANLITGNIPAKNGIIHVIDTVLTPHVPTVFQGIGETKMASLIEKANLTDIFGEGESKTLLVPRDAVWESVLAGNFWEPDYIFHLKDLLLYHLLPEQSMLFRQFEDNSTLVMANQATMNVDVNNTHVFFSPTLDNPAQLVAPGLVVADGIVHTLSNIVSPPSLLYDVATMARKLGLNSLMNAFDQVNLTGLLESPVAHVTLFAPTNAALEFLQGLLDDPMFLEETLGFHLVDGVFPSSSLKTRDSVQTFIGEDLRVVVNGDEISFPGNVGVSVIDQDIPAKNGIIHIVDMVLLPEQPAQMTENISNTSLGEAVEASSILPLLEGGDPITFLRPTKSAFADLPSRYMDPKYKFHLNDILTYHVALEAFGLENLTDGTMMSMANGESVNVQLAEDIPILTPSMTGSAKILGSQKAFNGFAHTIDDVMSPFSVRHTAPNVLEREGLTMLVRALDQSNLTELLSDPDGTFTIFAPSNSAFEQTLSLDALFADSEKLREVMEHHILDDIVHSDMFLNESLIVPLSGKTVSIEADENFVAVVGFNTTALMQRSDIPARNAIVHIIDEVFIPPDMFDFDATASSVPGSLTSDCNQELSLWGLVLFAIANVMTYS